MYTGWFHNRTKSSIDVSFYFNLTIVTLLSFWKMAIIEGLCELSSDKNTQINEWPFKFLVLCTVWWAHNSDAKGLNLLQYQTHLAL
jgi:hypothetical protein